MKIVFIVSKNIHETFRKYYISFTISKFRIRIEYVMQPESRLFKVTV